MTKIYLVHRWEGSDKSDWYPWLKTKLANSFDIEILKMPNPDEPTIAEWVGMLSKSITSIDENIILIGHSIGCQTILRFLQTRKPSEKVQKVIMVAPWVELTEKALDGVEEIAKPWLETTLIWPEIKKHANKFVAIFSENDPFVDLNINSKVFKDELSAEIISLNNKGHFAEDDGVTEFEELLEILNLV